MEQKIYDVIIVGAGAAGLTAAIYTSRKKLSTLIISVDVGGQSNLTYHVENYPGFDMISGPDLMNKFLNQAMKWGAELMMGKVSKVSIEKEEPERIFKVELSNGEQYFARALILAFGKVPRTLGVPGEERLTGKGVSYCVTCDAPLFKDKDVVVVGGGNSAVEGALDLAKIARKVYLVHRRNAFRADAVTVEKLKEHDNIELFLDSVVEEILGEKVVEKVKVKNVKTNEVKEIKCQGVFIEIGYTVDNSCVKGLVELNERGEIIIDQNNRTNVPGIFAAGDVTNVPYKQIVISAGEGSKAALEAHKYLTGGIGTSIDWSK